MPGLFSGQVAVVSGASSGIGKAIALALSAQGANLCLVGRSVERLQEVAQQASCTERPAVIYKADLTQDSDIQQLGAWIRREFAQVHLLIHSAGIIASGGIEAASAADFDRQYQVNLRAPYLLTQILMPMLLAARGQVAFINSSAGLQARAGFGQYAATKHALKAIADALREEVNARGVRVLSVFPGRTATPMQADVHRMEGSIYQPERLLQPADVAAAVVSALCAPTTAEVTEISIRPMRK